VANTQTNAELQDQQLYRDTRPLSQRLIALIQSRRAIWVHAGLCAVAIMPMAGPLALGLSVIAFLVFRGRTVIMPMQIPAHMPYKRDPNNPDPANNYKPGKPAGSNYHGLTIPDRPSENGQEIWSSKEVDTRHRMYLATTGGGKTAALTSQLVNTFCQGSGCIYTDGKAQMDVPIRVASLAHRFGRLPDMLVINYMRGGLSPWESSERKLTHTFSLIHGSSATMVAEAFDGLLQVDNDMWGQRARLLMRAISFLVKYLSEQGHCKGTLADMSALLDLELAAQWAYDADTPKAAAGLLEDYIKNLSTLTEGQLKELRSGKVPEEAGKQHGFIIMQLVPLLAPLMTEYGDILSPDQPDMLVEDVVVNNRIAMFLLPALEKSGATVSSLGRVIVGVVKGMMAKSIVTHLEGNVADNLDRLATNTDSVFPLIWDEVGYYMTEEHAVKAAQGRSLNMSEWYGTQDIAAMKKGGESAARATESVIGNTALKAVGVIEDMNDTLRLIKERADEAAYTEQTQLTRAEDSESYYSQGVGVVRRSRLTAKKLARLAPGELYWLWQDKLIHGHAFYANVKRIETFKLNRFAPQPAGVEVMGDGRLTTRRRVGQLLARLADEAVRIPEPENEAQITEMLERFQRGHADVLGYVDEVCQRRREELASLLDFGATSLGGSEQVPAVNEATPSPPPPPAAVPSTNGPSRGEPAPQSPNGGGRYPPPRPAAAPEPEPTGEPYLSEAEGQAVQDTVAARYRPYLDLLFASLNQSEQELIQGLKSLEEQQGPDAPGGTGERVRADVQAVAESLAYPRAPYPSHDPKRYAQIARELTEQIQGRDGDEPGGAGG